MGRKGHGASATAHAIRRARERYELTLTPADVARLGEDVRRGRAKFLARQSASRTHWLVEHAGVEMHVVYHKGVKGIITALPPDVTIDSLG